MSDSFEMLPDGWFARKLAEPEPDWKPGDPCGACGSRDTGWGDAVEGAVCHGCGASDADE